jgi:two-component system cell cycle sensor histidine kinase/response regulator CckA
MVKIEYDLFVVQLEWRMDMPTQNHTARTLLGELRTLCKTCKDESHVEQLQMLLDKYTTDDNFQEADDKDIKQQIAQAIHNIDDAVMITTAVEGQDSSPLIQYVNPAFTQMTGYLQEELVGKCPQLLNGPETDLNTVAKIRASVRANQSIRTELLDYRKDGTEFWSEMSIVPIVDAHGKFTNCIVVKRDVTERKKTEYALMESEMRFKALADSAPVMIWEVDVNRKCTYLNKVWLDFTGQILEQEHGMPFGKGVHPEDFSRCRTAFIKGFTERQPIEIEHRLQRYDGEYRWILSTGVPKFTRDGVFTGYIGSSMDITERKKAEDQLRFHADIINQITEPVFGFDPNMNFTFWNKAAEHLYGYSESEVLGRNLTDVLKRRYYQLEDEQTAFYRFYKADNFTIKLLHTKRNGEEFPVCVSGRATYDGSGNRIGLVAVVLDMTEAKKAEQEKEQLTEQLLQSQKMEAIGTLASGISHDFNNILTSISGYAALLRKASPDDPLNVKRLTRIEESAERAATLTRQILGFARQGKSNALPCKLSDCIESVIRLIEPTLDKRIQLIAEVQQGLPYIEGDRNQLEQVLLNLAVNAIDAMMQTIDQKGSGHLRFTLSLEPLQDSLIGLHHGNSERPFVSLVVSDDGVGIPEAIRSKIFDPFFTTKAIGKGTGLGLSMVYGIVASHQGFITVESEVGKGTKFHLFFPAIQRKPKPKPLVDKSSQKRMGSGIVLVIDDDVAISEMVSEVLRDAGFTVLTAEDGDIGIQRFSEHADKIGLVILDMNMPKMNGKDTFHHLKKIHPSVKVLLATGYSENLVAGEMIKQGLAGVISKPYSVDEVVQKVLQFLG